MRRWRSPYPNAPPFPPATTRSGLTCRLFLNPHAKTHLRIWKPILKNATTLAKKFSMEIKIVLLAFNPAIQYARSSIDRFISFQPSKSICRQGDESSMTGENKDKYLFGGIDQQSTQGKVCVVDSYYCPQSIR
ncbi:hypothetical protein CMV_017848 [Castanea mollissima]|uniref:Uncharacterized protein n=1 Tax=Castanea mollissima TaxID=60419 RepID=A0A8J4QQE5_9ROSI|nr:hypothetical protein CMV_017848 [Castanea mollissima]